MTTNASAERLPQSISRYVTVNAGFILGTFLLVVIAAATGMAVLLARMPGEGWTNGLGRFADFSWVLIGVMLIGLAGSAGALIRLFVYRLASGGITAAPAHVRVLNGILLAVSVAAVLCSAFFLLFIMPRFVDLFKDFDIQLPGLTIFYLVFTNFITNPINLAISCVALAPLVVLFVMKEFLFKDKIAVYLLNGAVAFCTLAWLVFAYIAGLLPLISIISEVQ